jgi:general L-amino acid transport system permease protein
MRSRAPVSLAIPTASPRRPPPARERGLMHWLRTNLFNDVPSTMITLLCVSALGMIAPHAFRWAILDAVWTSADGEECRGAAGACWAIVGEKYRLILFGTFPYQEHWRGWSVILIIVALAILSAFRRFWSWRLFLLWIAATVVVLVLMLGGVLGLRQTGTHEWGGLPLTLLLFVGTIVGGLPLAILLALGRRSRLPVIQAVSIATIEITRGIPLLAVLFIASVMFPLFVPEQLTIDKVLRAQIGMIVFFAAYAAEVVRGGLQAIARGQYDAADAIGLGYWQSMRRIVLPQALRIVIPALMNDIIRAFKNTTFVSIIGLFDVLGAAKAALEDPRWIRFAPEAYLFVFALYFVFCASMSQYSESVERDLRKGRNF